MAGKDTFASDFSFSGFVPLQEDEHPIYPLDYRQLPGLIVPNPGSLSMPMVPPPRNFQIPNQPSGDNREVFQRPENFESFSNAYMPQVFPDRKTAVTSNIFDQGTNTNSKLESTSVNDNTYSAADKQSKSTSITVTTNTYVDAVNKSTNHNLTGNVTKPDVGSSQDLFTKDPIVKIEPDEILEMEPTKRSHQETNNASMQAKTDLIKYSDTCQTKHQKTKEVTKELSTEDNDTGSVDDEEEESSSVTDNSDDESDATIGNYDHENKTKKMKKGDSNSSQKKKAEKLTKEPKKAEPVNLTCEECGKTVKSLGALEKHKNLHTGVYSCHICKKIFNSKSSLQGHAKVHKGFVGDQKCNVCDKVFYDKSSLNKHTLSVHMGIKHHQCRFCPLSFYAKKTLDEHERVHTGERPFKCDLCPKTYKRIADLNHHLRLHKGEVSHTCEKCGEGFRRKSELKRHMQKHADDPPTDNQPSNQGKVLFPPNGPMAPQTKKIHKCQWCNIVFSTSMTLTRHIETHMENNVLPKRVQESEDSFSQEKQKMVDQIVTNLGAVAGVSVDKPNDASLPGNYFGWNVNQAEDLRMMNRNEIGYGNAGNMDSPEAGIITKPVYLNPSTGTVEHVAPSVSQVPTNPTLANVEPSQPRVFKDCRFERDISEKDASMQVSNSAEILNTPVPFPTDAHHTEPVDLNRVKQEVIDNDNGVYVDHADGGLDDDYDRAFGDSDDDYAGKSNTQGEVANEDNDYGGDTDVEDGYNYVLDAINDVIQEGIDKKPDMAKLDAKVGRGKGSKKKQKKKVSGEDSEGDSDDVDYIPSVKGNGSKINKRKASNKSPKKRKQTSPKKRKVKQIKVKVEEDEMRENEIDEDEDREETLNNTDIEGKSKKRKYSGKGSLIHDKGNVIFECRQCDKQFTSRCALKKHKNLHSGAYTCSLCTKSFACQASLDTHMANHDGQRMKSSTCNVCDKSFYDVSSLNKHVKNVHMAYKPFACTDCDRRFSERKTLVEHIRVHTGERPYACEFCGKTFKRAGELNYHIRRTHTDEVKYHCEVCGKGFLRPHQLKIHHLEKHNPTSPFRCSACRKYFPSKGMLADHRRLNHKANRYHCERCGKGFYQKAKLNKHYNIKSDCSQNAGLVNGFYVCKFCFNEFEKISDRDDHIRQIHASEKLVQTVMCNVCGKSFTRGQGLRIHMKIHMQVRDFKCTQCDASFVQKHHLAQHIRTHTGEKPFQCNICFKSFAQNATLYSHMKHH